MVAWSESGVLISRARVSFGFRVSFCLRVAVDVQLLYHSERVVGVFVLVSFHMMEDDSDGCAFGCFLADSCVNIIVVWGSVIRAFNSVGAHLHDIGEDTLVITITLEEGKIHACKASHKWLCLAVGLANFSYGLALKRSLRHLGTTSSHMVLYKYSSNDTSHVAHHTRDWSDYIWETMFYGVDTIALLAHACFLLVTELESISRSLLLWYHHK